MQMTHIQETRVVNLYKKLARVSCFLVEVFRGATDPDLDPDPAGYPVNLVDPGRIWIRPNPMYLDPAGSEVGSGKYWPDVHNYDIKHHSIFSLLEMTHDNT